MRVEPRLVRLMSQHDYVTDKRCKSGGRYRKLPITAPAGSAEYQRLRKELLRKK